MLSNAKAPDKDTKYLHGVKEKLLLQKIKTFWAMKSEVLETIYNTNNYISIQT